MTTPEFPALTIARQELEECWRLKVEEAQGRYQAATAQYRHVLRDQPEGLTPSVELMRDREAESQALGEYTRVLRVFTDLTVHGKMPEEQSTSGSDWAVTVLPEVTVISIVDDDESIRAATKTLLRSVGYRVGTFASAEQFLDSGALGETECLILDVRMPGMNGLELQRRLKSSDSGVPIIFITAQDDKANRRQAIEAGAVEFLCKPFEANTLVSAIQTALSHKKP